MPEGNKTTNDLYREVIQLHESWREENKSLLLKNHEAISTLDSIRKEFSIFKWVITGLVIATLIVCMSALVYTGKLKFCKVQYGDFSLTTDNCIQQNDLR